MKKICLCLLLTAVLIVGASAFEVPARIEVQNINGRQQVVKTYTVSPETDAQSLIEEPFQMEGFLYTYADIVKSENQVSERRTYMETVTVETDKENLDVILVQLAPTMEYDDGIWFGTLTLDHTSIQTKAAGYTTKSNTVTDTRIIGPLDRNDMSYVPATVEKDGVILDLVSVDWQVIGTELVGDILIPCSYQAAATYTGKSYYSAVTGYVTTVNYVGEVIREGVESITYQVTYLGRELMPAEPKSESAEDGENLLHQIMLSPNSLHTLLCALGAVIIVVLVVVLILSRRTVRRLRIESMETQENENGEDPEA